MTSITTPLDRNIISRFLIVILAFAMAVIAIMPISIQKMGVTEAFIFQVLPLPYWIAIVVLAISVYYLIPHTVDKQYRILLVFSTVVLLTCFRIVFPVIFTTIPAYEPDAVHYLTVVNSWTTNGIDFSTGGNYQHDYPLSYLIGFVMVKLGIPITVFFRWAPFFLYAFDLIVLYFIIEQVMPKGKNYGAAGIFLFSFSSLGYWVSVHYCPDLLGSLLYLIALYFCIKFALDGDWPPKRVAAILSAIVLLVLSHHLSTLYFIVTMFGLAFAAWFFKTSTFKGKWLPFFVLGVFTCTFWFAYGILMYPSFFNIFVYFSGFASLATLSQNAGFLNNIIFIVYPAFIFILFGLSFLKYTIVRRLSDLKRIKQIVLDLQTNQGENLSVIYSIGFIPILTMFVVSVGVPVLQAPRILEVLLIGLYPLASKSLVDLYEKNSTSKKKNLLLLIIILLIILIGVYRYYSQIQRRVISTW